jgi:hypothetical protein
MSPTLDHDPEKWKPVFREDHAKDKDIPAMALAMAFESINHSRPGGPEPAGA